MDPSSVRIAPSILSADFGHLADQLALAEAGGADLIHVDVMDGCFVPNITIGPMIVEAVDGLTSLPLDVHLMVQDPERYIDDFVGAGADMLCLHVEATRHLHKALVEIRDRGVAAGVALNPATPLVSVTDVLEEVDFVTVMSVNPGFGGQQFIAQSVEKIRALAGTIRERDVKVEVEVDGGVTDENAADVIAAGARILVAGSFVFKAPDVPEAIQRLRAVAAP
ncbi:MAG: ribulose-phosphate 3-epimerase [Actinobacteria bacterium]|nr:MAG: ribulose-phosphate 3-epimerase [Actinomycetota bacterium]